MNIISQAMRAGRRIFTPQTPQQHAESPVTTPTDEVVLGGAPACKAPPAPPQTPSAPARPAEVPAVLRPEAPPPAPAQERPSTALSSALGEHVFTVARAQDSAPQGSPERVSAETTLSQLATHADPLVAIPARATLTRWFEGDTSLHSHTMQLGPSEGAARFVRQLDRWMANAGSDTGIQSVELPAALDQLRASRPSERAVASVTHLAQRLHERATDSLSSRARVFEPRAKQNEDFEACCALLTEWWSRGDLQVVRDGRTVTLGQVNLAEVLAGPRVPVDGRTLDITPPPPPPAPALQARAREALDGIVPGWENGPPAQASGYELLETLQRNDPQQASQVFAAVLHELQAKDSPDDWARAEKILYRSGDSLELKALVAPHLDTFAHLVSEADKRGLVGMNPQEGRARSQVVFGLWHRYPEKCDADFMRREVRPLWLAEDEKNEMNVNGTYQAYSIFDVTLKKNPSVAAVAAETVLEAPYALCANNVSAVLTRAFQDGGWQPTDAQLRQVVALMVQPADKDATQYIENGYCLFGAGTAILNGVKPERLEGLRMPDPQGKIVPLKDAIFEHMLNVDPTTDRYKYAEGGLRSAGNLIFHDEAYLGRLTDIATSAFARTTSTDRMTQREKAALVYLSERMPKEGFSALIAPGLRSRHSAGIFAEKYDDMRAPLIEADLATLQSGTLTPAAMLATVRNSLELVHASPSMFATFQAEKLFEALQTQWNAATSGRTEAVDALVAELTPAFAGRTLDTLEPKLLAPLHALVYLGKKDASVRAQLTPLMAPHLAETHRVNPNMYANWLEEYRQARVLDNVQALGATAMPPAERATRIEENRRIAHAAKPHLEKRVVAEARKAVLEGALSRNGQKLYTTKLEILYNLYEALGAADADDAEIAARYATFTEVLDMAGRDSYARAAEGYAYLQAELAAGRDRDEALAHLAKSFSLGRAPNELAANENRKDDLVVERGTAGLRIGGISVPVRRA